MDTVSARGALMLQLELDMESPSPPLLRTATTFTDTSWPLDTPSASLIPVLPALSSRGLSSILATARGALMLLTDMESVTELPSPPPLRTVTMCTDMSLLPVMPSASLTPVLLDLSSRGLSSTQATARGALMLLTDMELVTESPSPPLLITATTSTDTNWPLDTPSASLTPVLRDLSSRGLSSTPATARGPLSPSTEELLSTRVTLCLPLTGLFRV